MTRLTLGFALLFLGAGNVVFAQGPKRPNFEFRFERVGNTFQGIRFMPATGQSWLIVVDRWQDIPETGKVPPGDFDVRIIATDKDFTAFRLDRKSGKTWQLKGRRWVEIAEPKVKAARMIRFHPNAKHDSSHARHESFQKMYVTQVLSRVPGMRFD